ncbi:hypothetical protein B0H14DRAFT_3168886 [Mycena olivaceomarginata]|nr:hypothetical protein B0H14DRAFT_3168886 [Mycena olivaceomarginata]
MPALFNPLRLGSTTISNRIGMSALTRNRADVSTTPNELMKEYYLQRATGGCGLIVNEGTLITRQGTEWPQAPGIWNKEQVALALCVDFILPALSFNLGKNHSGALQPSRRSGSRFLQACLCTPLLHYPPAWGKFRFIPGIPGYVTPTEIEDPTSLILLYKEAAINAKEAGFDGVEPLPLAGNPRNSQSTAQVDTSFTSFSTRPPTTARTNGGGSAENRSRFGLEVLKAVIEVFGADVAVKLSPAGGYGDMGMPLEETIETYSYFISEADKLGLSYICLARFVPSSDIIVEGKSRGIPHDVIGTYRPLIKNTKVFANEAFTPEEAEEVVSAGTLDGVFFGVLWLTHPDLAKRVQHGKPLDNTPDVETFYGHPGSAR